MHQSSSMRTTLPQTTLPQSDKQKLLKSISEFQHDSMLDELSEKKKKQFQKLV